MTRTKKISELREGDRVQLTDDATATITKVRREPLFETNAGRAYEVSGKILTGSERGGKFCEIYGGEQFVAIA